MTLKPKPLAWNDLGEAKTPIGAYRLADGKNGKWDLIHPWASPVDGGVKFCRQHGFHSREEAMAYAEAAHVKNCTKLSDLYEVRLYELCAAFIGPSKKQTKKARKRL